MFSKFLHGVLKSPGLIGVLTAAAFVAGFLTYRGMTVDLFPPLNFPTLNIITELPSYSSLEMERRVTIPIESAVGGVLGVTRVRSTSATGISEVTVDFHWGQDMLVARQLVLEALANAQGQLPAGAQPSLETLAATLSLIEGYSFQGGDDPVKLHDQAEYDLKPRLQRIPGIYKVIVMGGKILEYAVRLNPYRLIQYGVTLDDIQTALTANNVLANPGVVNHFHQELVLHVNGQFSDAGEIGNVVLAVKNGVPVRLRDVASVTQSYEYERGDSSANGSPAVLINIYKQPSYDTGEVADAVNREIRAFTASLPQGYHVDNNYDQAQLVRDSIGSVTESVWVGAVFVILVIAFFLRHIRSTLVAAVSIPVSVVVTLALMRAFNIGINIMSLGGLAIGTSIIVDNTIVVLENIFRWLSTPALRGRKSHSEVVVAATIEVLQPVIMSTLANIAIFVPMVFVAGFAGRLFTPVSYTVTFALLASLVVAVTVVPVLVDIFLAGRIQHKKEKEQTLFPVYERPLRYALGKPLRVVAAGIFLVAAAVLVFPRLNSGFLPELDEGAVLLNVLMPPGVSLQESQRFSSKLENWLKTVPGVVTVARRTGHAAGAQDTDNLNHSDIMIKLLPKNQRPLSLDDLLDQLQSKTDPLAGAQVSYLMPLADKINDALGGVPADLGVDLFGQDTAKLHEYASQLLAEMAKVRGITNLKPPTDIPVPSLEIKVDRKKAGDLGITEQTLNDTLSAYSNTGFVVTSIHELLKEINVTLYFGTPGHNLDWERLKSLPLRTVTGSTVPLEQVATLQYSEIPSEIYHDHMTRKLTVTADIQGRNAKDVASDVSKIMEGLHMAPGYSWGFSGKFETGQKALINMLMVLALAVCLVAFILWLEFKSLTQVFLILLTVPLAVVGAVFSLLTLNQSVNVSSMIGMVLLVGIVVRNGIILLDYFNIQRREGKSLEEAVAIASRMRVRPILMTASVMILGLLPLASGWGTGSELQRPLAIAVIGGIFTSTVLTLVVLPAAVKLMARFIQK